MSQAEADALVLSDDPEHVRTYYLPRYMHTELRNSLQTSSRNSVHRKSSCKPSRIGFDRTWCKVFITWDGSLGLVVVSAFAKGTFLSQQGSTQPHQKFSYAETRCTSRPRESKKNESSPNTSSFFPFLAPPQMSFFASRLSHSKSRHAPRYSGMHLSLGVQVVVYIHIRNMQ